MMVHLLKQRNHRASVSSARKKKEKITGSVCDPFGYVGQFQQTSH
jgi:hypothetical protein